MPAWNRAHCTGEISSEGTAGHTLGCERWCEDWICFVQYLCISIMVQWNLSAPTKYWVKLTFCITSFPLLPPFLPSFSGVNMCKQRIPWKFYLFKVLSTSTLLRRLWARIYWNWDLTCTVIRHPVTCCESEDGSSRMSNSPHQSWPTDSGCLGHDAERDSEAEPGLTGKEAQCLWKQRECAPHTWTLTSLGSPCSTLEFSWVCRNLF